MTTQVHASVIAAGAAATVLSASLAPGQPTTDRLTTPSQLVQHQCLPPCLCPRTDVSGAATGRFVLTPTSPDPVFNHYDITAIDWSAVLNNQPMRLVGSGTYMRSTSGPGLQQMSLDLSINGAPATHFDSGPVAASAAFPAIDVVLTTAINNCQQMELQVRAVATCAADWNGDGSLTPSDVAAFVNDWFASLQNGTTVGDLDGNGHVEPADVAAFVNTWFAELSSGCGA